MTHQAEFFGLRIITDERFGRLTVPSLPARLIDYRGPYRKRKRQRWLKVHTYWAPTGKFCFDVTTGSVLCHPSDQAALVAAVEKFSHPAQRVGIRNKPAPPAVADRIAAK